MRDLMLSVDVAITAAGQTTYELMSCGVPMIPIKVVDNQKWNILGLQNEGFQCLDSDTTHFDRVCWSDLIKRAALYPQYSLNGQEEIIKALTKM